MDSGLKKIHDRTLCWCTKPITTKFRTREKTSKPQLFSFLMVNCFPTKTFIQSTHQFGILRGLFNVFFIVALMPEVLIFSSLG